MTHEPELISKARQAWLEQVAKMSEAEKNGAVQAVMDAAFALGLVVVPKERVHRFFHRQEGGLERVVAIKELEARSMIQAAQAFAQLILEARAFRRTESRRLGVREAKFEIVVITPEEEPIHVDPNLEASLP